MKFELQYEWTPPQIFFYGYHVSQLFCHNVEEAHDVKYNKKKSWNWRFADFRDLVLILPEAATRGVQAKKVFSKMVQYSQEITCARVSF